MNRIIVVLVLVGIAALLGSPSLYYRLKTAAKAQPSPSPVVVTDNKIVVASPSPSPTLSVEPTPYPTPIDVPLYVWFNYKHQKANQTEWLFYFSYNEGKAEGSSMLVKCKLNKEFVKGLIDKAAVIEVRVASSKCRKIEP